MAHAEADDLADIFFGGAARMPSRRAAGARSQCEAQGTPCDSCDCCDSQALARVPGPFQRLRPAAIGCDSIGPALAQSQKIAANRKGVNGPESEQWRGESQESQKSQGPDSEAAATAGPALAALALVAWTDADIARFLDRRARLLRWGWAADDAEKLAERLARRDREHDERVSCTDCRHYRPGRCGNHRRAGLHAPDIGRDLATLLQRCPGFQAATVPTAPV